MCELCSVQVSVINTYRKWLKLTSIKIYFRKTLHILLKRYDSRIEPDSTSHINYRYRSNEELVMCLSEMRSRQKSTQVSSYLYVPVNITVQLLYLALAPNHQTKEEACFCYFLPRTYLGCTDIRRYGDHYGRGEQVCREILPT